MSRGGTPREGPTRQRTCIGCRAVRDQSGLVRVVLAPGGLARDAGEGMPGRGAYVCRNESCAGRGAARLAKALRRPGLCVSGPELWAVVRGEG